MSPKEKILILHCCSVVIKFVSLILIQTVFRNYLFKCHNVLVPTKTIMLIIFPVIFYGSKSWIGKWTSLKIGVEDCYKYHGQPRKERNGSTNQPRVLSRGTSDQVQIILPTHYVEI
uniref:Uncharacterized protein n=1 Tax=Micrurus carvalhoi TaxID=3147026 RepID=A0A2H6N0L9_9SAUR